MKRLLTLSLAVLCVFLYVRCSEGASPAQKHVGSGIIYYQEGEYDEAIAEFKKAIAIDPNYAGAYSGLGLVYDNQGKYDLAVRFLQKAISINPESSEWPIHNFIFPTGYSFLAYPAVIHYNLGSVYHKQGKSDLAVRSFQKAITIDPEDVVFHYNLGRVYHDQGKYGLAVRSYQKAIATDPEDADAYNNFCNVGGRCE